MVLSKTIAKAEKLSGQKCKEFSDYGIFSVTYKGYLVEIYANGRIADDKEPALFTTTKIGYKVDTLSDYFPGTYHDNLTQCFKFIDRR
jgi:hypothetical protein